MDPSQQRAAVGSSLYKLIKRGVVEWGDAVTGSRVRTLREVVARGKLTVDAMLKAGVREPIAQHAWQAVNTPELAVVKAHRKALVEALDGAGVKRDKVIEATAEALADRIVVRGIDLGGAGARTTPPKIGPDDLVRLLGLDKPKVKAALKPKAKPKPKPEPKPEPEPGRLKIEWKGGVTEEEARDMMDVLAEEIPREAMRRLEEFGAKFVYVVKNEDEMGAEAVKRRPRGWDEGDTWENADGYYSPDNKAIVVAKTYVDALTGETRRSKRTISVMFHETGHAIDHAYGYLSEQEAFRKAHAADDAAMTNAEDRAAMSYLLQKGDAGPSEAFAELSAYLFTNPLIKRNMKELFPQTTKWLWNFYGFPGSP